MRSSIFILALALVAPAAAFAPSRQAPKRVAPVSMSAESRILGLAAETKLLSRVASSGVLSKADKAGVTLTDIEALIASADDGLLDTAIALIESPLAEPVTLVLGGQSPLTNVFRPSVGVSKEDKDSLLLRKVSQKKLLTLVAKRGLLSKADKAGFTLSDLEPLLKTADDAGAVELLASAIDDVGPTLVQFAPRALPLAGGVLNLLSPSAGPPSISLPSAPSISLPSAPALPTAKKTAPAKAVPTKKTKKAAVTASAKVKSSKKVASAAKAKAAATPETVSFFGGTFAKATSAAPKAAKGSKAAAPAPKSAKGRKAAASASKAARSRKAAAPAPKAAKGKKVAKAVAKK